MKESLNLYEEQLANLYCSVDFKKDFAFVPSFLELYPLHSDTIYFQQKLNERRPHEPSLSSVQHCNFTLDFSCYPIFQTHFRFPWRLVKSRFHCNFENSLWEARWPHGQCAQLRSERSGFEPWPGTLCCVLGQDTLLSRCLSPPRCINGYRRT